MRVLSPITAHPRHAPGVGEQDDPLASCARGRRHTRPIVLSARRCSFTRARLRQNGSPLKKHEQEQECRERCGRLVEAAPR